MNTENRVTVNREYKSSVFALLFKDKKKLLSLYNALNLKEYMLYVAKIRNYIEKEKMSLQDAVELAVDVCIREGILEEFLRENRAEVVSMSIFEFDAEKEWKLMREAEYQYGVEDGIERGLSALITTLKKRLLNLEEVYNAVIENEVYKDVTREQVEKYF